MEAMSYLDYLEKYGIENTPTDDERAEAAEHKRQAQQAVEDHAEIKRLMESITAQFTEGADPQYILYNAVQCIGLLAHDAAWADDCTAQIYRVYGDLAQQCLLVDVASIARQRLDDQRADFVEKTQKAMERQLKLCEKITAQVKDALETINAMDNKGGESATD